MKSRLAPVIITAAVTAVVTAVLTSIFWLTGAVIAYRHFGKDAPAFAVNAEAPQEVALGKTFTLKLRVSNPSDEELELGSIDVYDSLLNGFTVVRVQPKPTDQDHFFDFSTFYFSKSLVPGESFSVSLVLKAEEPGIWTGNVDFCTPEESYVSSSVTIRVRGDDKEPAEVAPVAE
jgi:hypothetical protein